MSKVELLRQKNESVRKQIQYRKENKLEFYDPYKFQQEFHNDSSPRKALQSANKIGKTWAVCAEDGFDLTGNYPDWWEGNKFTHPVRLVCGGVNNDKTRDLLQKALFGDPVLWEDELGLGWIPKKHIGKIQKKRGVSDAFMHVKVKHHTDGVFDGWSNITFQSYESGKEAWMGDEIDVFHLDEEPPKDILDQAARGCISSGGSIRMSYTPENGKTEVVRRVEEDWSMHRAGWKHVASGDFSISVHGKTLSYKKMTTLGGVPGHMTKEKLLLAAKSFPAYQLKMRSEGEPVLGSGLVYTYDEEQIKITPLDQIPESWPQGSAIDFGGQSDGAHPTAVIWMALDPINDVIYVYDGFRSYGNEVAEVAARIISKPNRDWIPMFWPHDGKRGKNHNDPAGGTTAEQYRNFGIKMWETHFTNPDEEVAEGKGKIAIEPGVTEISGRINDRRIRIFRTFDEWFEEYRNYHQKEGKIVDLDDDLMAATRYCIQMRRHWVAENDAIEYEEDDDYEYNNTRDSVTGY